jgi:hypothetical protein
MDRCMYIYRLACQTGVMSLAICQKSTETPTEPQSSEMRCKQEQVTPESDDERDLQYIKRGLQFIKRDLLTRVYLR